MPAEPGSTPATAVGWVPASLLHHRGYGDDHYDLVIGCGSRCPTLRIADLAPRAEARWIAAHRRRYLAYQGPISGARGSVRAIWRGACRWWREPGGWAFQLGTAGILRVHRGRLAAG